MSKLLETLSSHLIFVVVKASLVLAYDVQHLSSEMNLLIHSRSHLDLYDLLALRVNEKPERRFSSIALLHAQTVQRTNKRMLQSKHSIIDSFVHLGDIITTE